MHSYYQVRGQDAGRATPANAQPGHSRRDQDKRSGSERVKEMGGLQAKFPRPSTSSTSSHQAQASRSSSASQPDGQQRPLHPSIARVLDGAEEILPLNQRRDFQSLDRSLKAFLRASNLPGLEYRLRLAGYQKLDDLLDADVERLSSQGFTRLMAKRLMTSLDDYIRRHLYITEGQPSPFQLVRRGHLGQKIKSDPTDDMKALPNFGKRNVKRQSSSEQVTWRQPGRKRTTPRKHPSSAMVRLMSEEQIPSEPIFPNVIDVRDSVFVGEGDSTSEGSERSLTTSSSSSSQMVELGRVVQIRSTSGRREGGEEEEEGPAIIPVETSSRSSTMFEEFFMDDVDTPAPALVADSDHNHQQERVNDILLPHQTSFLQYAPPPLGYKLRATSSIPASFWFSCSGCPLSQYPEHTYIRVRAYSCPPSLASMATPLEDLLSVLTSAQEVESIISALKQLISQLREKREGDRVEMIEAGVLPALVDVLQMESTSQRVAERVAMLSCKVIKLLTREGVLPVVTIPAGTAVAVLEAMNYHPTSENLQTEGCLALGNMGRTDPSQCDEIIQNGGLQTMSLAMENFTSSTKLQVVAMAALAVVLGAVKDARLLLISDYGRILDIVFQMMQFYPGKAQLQQYSCALLALLIAEVGAQVESGVMQLIVEHTTVAMTTQPHDNQVTLWAAKVFANAAENAIFADHKLAGRCAELLVEAISMFSENSDLVSWCSYALLQLTSSGCDGVVSHVIRASQLPAYCQTPPTCLSEKARDYLKQLEKLN